VNRLLAGGALAILIAAMIAIALTSRGSDGGNAATTTAAAPTRTARGPKTKPKPAKAAPARIALAPVGPYDPPPGDGTENDAQVPNALDGNPSTFWSTEHYTHGFFKPGVGIVLDAGRSRRIARVLVGTDSPGSRAEIQLADVPTGPYHVVSADKPLVGTTAFPLRRGAKGRYVLVWVTALPADTGEAHITEVRAFGG
jgi:hypothetical protein